ncbi:MAG: hypothetical protein H6709_00335 [Kofleriaceae bacterium]|nr:hypothetical protein [Kofleriaceae bacterium]MCB9570514.1 hypothetical protein [Kofleriaceae bacterium]
MRSGDPSRRRLASACPLVLVAVAVAGCYHGARATRDVNRAWQGRSRAELEARWGRPATVAAQGDGAVLTWSISRQHVELPSASASLTLAPGSFDAQASWQAGKVWTSTTEVVAAVDAGGRVVGVDGPSLRWGAPRGLNLRWGAILGLHVGMGRLDDTGTPLPSGGLYLGGMIGPRLGLVGTMAMVSGSDDAGGAMGFAWGMGAQWWPSARVALRAGPALVLAFDPGFEDPSLGPGLDGAASLALVRAGSFVLDLRLDLVASPSSTFGSVGVGVNVN